MLLKGGRDRDKAIALFGEAAELGHASAQFHFGKEKFVDGDWQRCRWWGRAAARDNGNACYNLRSATRAQLQLFDDGIGSGRLVFELGLAFNGHLDVARGYSFGRSIGNKKLCAAQRCVELRVEWCSKAKAAIECWIGVGRRFCVAKDIRLLIARMVWAEPWAWCRVMSVSHPANN